MRKLIALEPRVYDSLKRRPLPEKIVSDLDQRMREILNSQGSESEKMTLYNEALQKSRLFLKRKLNEDTALEDTSLNEATVLKPFTKKRAKAKKILNSIKSKKNLSWDREGTVLLDHRKVPGTKIESLLKKSLKKPKTELDSLIWESV